MSNLTPKMRIFVEAYDGDLPYAMRIAGYNGVDAYLEKQGQLFLDNPRIIEAIRDRTKYMTNLKNTIANREERQQFWTDVMRNEVPHLKEEFDGNNVPIKQPANVPLAIRLKASETLGKSETDFVEKIDMAVQHSLSDLVMQSYLPATENELTLEEIEQMYKDAKKLPDINVTPTPSQPETIDDLI